VRCCSGERFTFCALRLGALRPGGDRARRIPPPDVATTLARLLTERERRFLRAYFGFDTGEKVTLEEIGAVEGLTCERVRQVSPGRWPRCALTRCCAAMPTRRAHDTPSR
jgi:hypothetical protein